MQYRRPVGLGPSSNTCPKWAPQLAHSTSVRRMNKLRSAFSSMLSFRTGAQKLGQPVPESYFVSEANRSRPQTTQMYTPGSWLFQYSPVKGRSVPLLMQTSYCSGESRCRRLASSNFSTRMNAQWDRLKIRLGADIGTIDIRMLRVLSRPGRPRGELNPSHQVRSLE